MFEICIYWRFSRPKMVRLRISTAQNTWFMRQLVYMYIELYMGKSPIVNEIRYIAIKAI